MKRNHYRYKLNHGRKVVYYGITNDPQRRESEHEMEGKRFDNMIIVGSAVKKDTALNWEQNKVASYKRNHCGRKPRYNKK